jgi:hypothetical protein
MVLASAAGAPPPPGGGPPPPGAEGGGAVGPVGVPQISSSFIDPGSSWIEWRVTLWGNEEAYINSSNPNAMATVFRSGALGKVAVMADRREGRTVFVQDYFLLHLPLWQQEILGNLPERVEFLPGVKILVSTPWGWRTGTIDDVGESFSIINGIPTKDAIYPLVVSVP